MQNTKELFIIKINYKNFIGFLTIKELSQRQVKWAEMLTEYHFKIKHVKRSDNARADALSKKEELQKSDKVSEALFKENSNKKIKYNHPQLSGTYKALINL